MAEKVHIGIDYGTKMGGSTAICFKQSNKLYLSQSEPKRDADQFIASMVSEGELTTSHIYIDAPLSLPLAYFGKGDDYFFRQCDRAVRAMSPMFIGGLTARAIKLKSVLLKDHPDLTFHETYPGYLAREVLDLKDKYNKKSKAIAPFLKALEEYLPLEYVNPPANWHQVDAVLAWLSGYRHMQGSNISVGDETEGLIII